PPTELLWTSYTGYGLTVATSSPFSESEYYAPAETDEHRGVVLPARFGSAADEYRVASERVALFERSDRGLLIVTGADRKEWLHNMVTNAVKTLDENLGNYAFAIDVKGRVQFDLNILNLREELWLDIDAPTVGTAQAHFDRYLLNEDVQMRDATARFARLGCCGPRAAEIAGRLGITNFPAMAALSSFGLNDGSTRFVRHDFAGRPGFELILPRVHATAWWQRLVRDWGVSPAGHRTLDVLRIEAGIPWLHRDIDNTVLPPETGQVERGVSYHKGCYLGQEIIERMRSRGSLARRLVRVHADEGQGLKLPARLRQNDSEVGRVTSLVWHPLTEMWVGLGYLRTKVTEMSGITAGEPPRAIHVEAA
ncbi:MAG: YgfZ/GcvT domain-containing protein, partial [Phycisphaerae bacterium]